MGMRLIIGRPIRKACAGRVKHIEITTKSAERMTHVIVSFTYEAFKATKASNRDVQRRAWYSVGIVAAMVCIKVSAMVCFMKRFPEEKSYHTETNQQGLSAMKLHCHYPIHLCTMKLVFDNIITPACCNCITATHYHEENTHYHEENMENRFSKILG